MQRLPERPNLDHLKKQAKDLLALARRGDPDAAARLHATTAKAASNARLSDAQLCIARAYGFASWPELKAFVAVRQVQASDRATALRKFLALVYAGDIAGGANRARPRVAARILSDRPGILDLDDPYLACAVGNEQAIRRETQRDPAWVNEAGGPLALPPLVAVTQSSLIQLPDFRDGLLASARHLLDAGADPNQSVPNRWMTTREAQAADQPLSALYGAAGQNRDLAMTRLLLQSGADPNDGESLYHSLENPECTRLLLEAGARITGTNAIYRALDLDDVAPIELLLAHGGNPNEPPPGPPTSEWGSPLLWAIRRRRSKAHVELLLAAGADASVETPGGQTVVDLALRFGLTEVARLVESAGGARTTTTPEDEFVAACARADAAEAGRLLAQRPRMFEALSKAQLQLLPELAAEGATEAVRVMVRLGWPIATRGGDWDASALNHAVFRGDAALARFLLEHGASWTETHGFGDNVLGSLSWASLNEPVPGGDWPGCAEALLEHGLPAAMPDPVDAEWVRVDGVRKRFSSDVTDILLAAGAATDGQVAG